MKKLVSLSDVAKRVGLPRPAVADFRYSNGIRPVTTRRSAGDWLYNPSDFAPLYRRAGAH